jgi:hypothetical protein
MIAIDCSPITARALRLIRRFDGDLTGNVAMLCHYTDVTRSRDKRGPIIEDCFRVTSPNHEATIYNWVQLLLLMKVGLFPTVSESACLKIRLLLKAEEHVEGQLRSVS